ncbi:MAG: carboxypeptidase regulatory-like domain-containing protein [Bryobacteraceae bacterium]
MAASCHLVGLFFLLVATAVAEVRLAGKVTTETNAPIGSARVSIYADSFRFHTVTDPAGAFQFVLPAPGEYTLAVEREGYFDLTRSVRLDEGENEATLVLTLLREVFESVEVTDSASAVGLDSTVAQETLSGNQILNIPYTGTSNLKNAVRLLPGAVRDTQGEIHINGGAADQVLYTLNGFNVTDPLTGRFESRISVESVQSVEVQSGRYSSEFGKGSAGVMAINTRSGDDQFRTSATNFFPGFETRKGLTLGNWTPRANISGPIRRGRAWFSNNTEIQYDQHIVPELPRGEDRTRSWRISNLLHNQFNLTPSNILYTSFLTNYSFAPRSGLSILDPPETTVDRLARQWFFNIKDQIYLARGTLLEFGYASNRTFGREIPQGRDLYIYTPEGKRGNYFVDAVRKASRDQVLANVFLPAFRAGGEHQIKAGIDLNRLGYWQDVERTGYEHYRLDGTPQRRTVFAGNGQLERQNSEAAIYVQDSWRARPGLLIEAGGRLDWDQILRAWTASPRIGLAWAPPGLESTRVSAGVGITADATNLRLFTRADDQYAMTTYFRPDGDILRGPAVSVYRVDEGRLRAPRYQNWSVGLDHRISASMSGGVHYLRKRGRRGLTYLNTIDAARGFVDGAADTFGTPYFDGIFQLGNQRRDSYDGVDMTFRHNFARQYQWMVSYTRSRSRSNAAIEMGADEPVLFSSTAGPMPWDAPNRLVSWGYLPTKWKDWAIAYMVEWRSGFPFSAVDDEGRQVGAFNAHRFPTFFDMNLHMERRFAARGHRWALRMGFNNITNHRNPTVVNNNVASPFFMSFYDGQRRAANVRIRWLGRI